MNYNKGNSRFTLVEISLAGILLVIIATFLGPQFISLKKNDPKIIITQNLIKVRKALELYYQQHGQNYPTATLTTKKGKNCSNGSNYTDDNPSQQFIDQMVLYTDNLGNTCSVKSETLGFIYGPYMEMETLINPLNNKDDIKIDKIETGLNPIPVDNTTGWIFVTQTGTFKANGGGIENF